MEQPDAGAPRSRLQVATGLGILALGLGVLQLVLAGVIRPMAAAEFGLRGSAGVMYLAAGSVPLCVWAHQRWFFRGTRNRKLVWLLRMQLLLGLLVCCFAGLAFFGLVF